MRTRIATRLVRLEHNTGTGSRRIVVVERGSLEAARAFLQGRADVNMERITFVITGVSRNGQDPEDWLRAVRGEAPVSRYGQPPDTRRATRQAQAMPQLDALKARMEAIRAKLSTKSTLAVAITFTLKRWPALTRYCEDGCLEIDNLTIPSSQQKEGAR
jgi:Transposase IS66 family